MKKVLCGIMLGTIILSLSACGSPKLPDENTIMEDLLSDKYDISTQWLQSYKSADDTNQCLPYEINTLTIEKRNTKEDTGYDSVWFDFTASNGIHKYTGSGSAVYKLYSQGGWIMEDCTLDNYTSKPAGKPRVAEMMSEINLINNPLEFPVDASADKFKLEEYYLNTNDIPSEYKDYTYIPQDVPMAFYRYADAVGPADGLDTQATNTLYILQYVPDTFDGESTDEEMMYRDYVGWSYYGMCFDDNTTMPEGKNEWRLYSAERLNAYSDADEHPGLFSVTITDGQITNVDILRTEYNKYFVFSTGVNCDDSNFQTSWADDYGAAIQVTGIARTDFPNYSYDDPGEQSLNGKHLTCTIDGSTLTTDMFWWERTFSNVATLVDTRDLSEALTPEQIIARYE
ncbi:hypothetical protein [Butyricicoccus sp. AM27-36]|uniref:hypothetical protein n=1 Tax=Butyricicoccus sp. AM27-36 TaxID=2292293 RepID=UPI000E516808|nr:hypothetical protein [Butyricicoccus sp. AM27-36]RHT85917.1 hypothetical protein DW724_14585 [Butyricicoccus sp. AM27-36]